MQIHVHIPSQTLDLLDEGGTLVRRYVVSTAANGVGFAPGSNQTPTGRFKIGEKIGDGSPEGSIFVSRVPTGEVGRADSLEDHVQTRILWLEGLDEENANSRERYIYIHGTNSEGALGSPSSHGCVRMANADVIDLYDRIQAGTPVTIQA